MSATSIFSTKYFLCIKFCMHLLNPLSQGELLKLFMYT